MSAALIFRLLFALMADGHAISISLGRQFLTSLFTMSEVPIESVGLKLFSGSTISASWAIPFFILAAPSDPRGVARRMIAFTTSLVGHFRAASDWPAWRRVPCSRDFGSSVATVWRSARS